MCDRSSIHRQKIFFLKSIDKLTGDHWSITDIKDVLVYS